MVRNGLPYKKFESLLLKSLENTHKVLDIGTSQKFAKELKPYENILNTKEYIAAGYNPRNQYGIYNCDCHQDIEKMTFVDNHFDAIICLEVLEHVKNPFDAIREMKRILKEEGKIFLSVPFLTQYHGKGSEDQSHDSYPDFWRFTHEGLQIMFAEFKHLEILPIDGPIEFRLRQMYLGKYLDRFALLRALIDKIDKPKLGKSTTRHILYGIK